MTKIIPVNVAVRKGDENEEKSVAMAATMPISQTARTEAATTSCRSSGAGAASSHATPASATDQGTRTKTRVYRARSRVTPRIASMSSAAAPTFHAGLPRLEREQHEDGAASTTTKTLDREHRAGVLADDVLPAPDGPRQDGEDRLVLELAVERRRPEHDRDDAPPYSEIDAAPRSATTRASLWSDRVATSSE